MDTKKVSWSAQTSFWKYVLWVVWSWIIRLRIKISKCGKPPFPEPKIIAFFAWNCSWRGKWMRPHNYMYICNAIQTRWCHFIEKMMHSHTLVTMLKFPAKSLALLHIVLTDLGLPKWSRTDITCMSSTSQSNTLQLRLLDSRWKSTVPSTLTLPYSSNDANSDWSLSDSFSPKARQCH